MRSCAARAARSCADVPRRPILRAVAAAGLIVAAPLAGQDGTPEGWNGPRAVELVERARDRRQEPLADSLLRNYRADASGHIYFFLDREESGEPVLLRADQVALELYWAQPGRTRQVIRGMRSEEQFPIKDFAYYLDRYTVIQNGFGDEIRVGEGRDVADVPHPLAPRAAAVYDYRLADSLTIRLPGRADPLRVYEIQVRPRDFGIPAIVGSLFLEQARGDLVRLAFTFTPAAYLDPRNERVEVVLEQALWEDRYWLPREQRLLVRREIPELDLDVGTVIRAVLRVDDLQLNVDIPQGFFGGRSVVVAAGPEGLAEYDFHEGLYDGLDDVGIAPGETGTLDEVDVERIAGRILRERFLRGIPRLRLWAPNASAILRFDRAEGVVTGAGLAWGLGEYQLTGYAARAWGAGRWIGEVAARPLSSSRSRWFGEAYWGRPVDLGIRPAAAGVIASAAALWLAEDYRDLYFEYGLAIGRAFEVPGGTLELGAVAEEHASPRLAEATAPFGGRDPFRPVLRIHDGRQLALAARARFGGAGVADRSELRLDLETGVFDPIVINEPDTGTPPAPDADAADEPRWFGVLRQEWLRSWRGADLRWGVDARQIALVTLDGARQHGGLIGGRNTLPGHGFRAWHADQLFAVDAEAWLTVVPRWLQVRALAAIAGGRFRPAAALAEPMAAAIPEPRDEVFGAVGAGLGFVDGLVRVHWALGLPVASYTLFAPEGAAGAWAPTEPPDGGVWTLSIDPRLWGFL